MFTLAVIHWNVDPEIFSIGSFSPRWYSLGFLFGFMVGYYIMQRIYIEDKVSTESLDDLLLYLIVGTVLGARIGHCVFYEWDYFQHHYTSSNFRTLDFGNFRPLKNRNFQNLRNFRFCSFSGICGTVRGRPISASILVDTDFGIST